MKSFWNGFEKQAGKYNKNEPSWKEDAIVGATGLVPFGTTAHSLVRDDIPEGKRLGNWAARVGGGLTGAYLGRLPGIMLGSSAKSKLIGSMAGSVGGSALGDIIGNRLTRGTKKK